MFITDEAGLLPSWLRFVQGVVDTEDLPLNVSREMLQATPVLGRIRNALTNRVLTELKSRAKDDEGYEKFWENFGPILKEGLWEDHAHQKDILPLARFRTTAHDRWTSLAEYVAGMKPGQEAIYVLAGDNIAALRQAPLLEGFRAAGVEVLLLADPIDAFWPDRCSSFEEKPIRNAIRSGDDLAKLAGGAETAAEAAAAPDVSALAGALKTALGDAISDVRASARLVESAVALAPGMAGGDLFRERLMRRAGRDFPAPAPVLEINPRHPLIAALAARAEIPDLAEIAATLLDLARVQEGEAPADAAAFARRVTALMTGGLMAGGLAAAPGA
jgi:molecular chaperone HtpG